LECHHWSAINENQELTGWLVREMSAESGGEIVKPGGIFARLVSPEL
jgi:hypothetical protein